MKLIDFDPYPKDDGNGHYPGIHGWELNILKFRRRSVINMACEGAIYQSFPSVLVQIGPSDVFQLSLGLVKSYFTISLWCRHYDY